MAPRSARQGSQAAAALGLPVLLFQHAVWLAGGSAGGSVVVVIEGSQGNSDSQQAVSGLESGIRKSSNAELKDEIGDFKYIFLETASGGLFVYNEAPVLPWVRRHLELLTPRLVLSVGSVASALVDSIARLSPVHSRPHWHFKCVQQHCANTSTGLVKRESCSHFVLEAKFMLQEAGRIRPRLQKVTLLNDGSDEAQALADSMSIVSEGERRRLCGECTVEVRPISSLADLLMTGAGAAAMNTSFLMLPSISNLNATAAEVWSVLQGTEAGAFVPAEVADLGGLATFRAHYGSAAQECGMAIAQSGIREAGIVPYEVRVSRAYKLIMNMQRALGLSNLEWYSGSLHHGGRESWEPAKFLWQSPAAERTFVAERPKVLIVHSYGRMNHFTDSEHMGFITGLKSAGHHLACNSRSDSCIGDLEVRTLYWYSMTRFSSPGDVTTQVDYARAYIKLWKPTVVFFTDEDVLDHLVVPCFEPLARGPHPRYHACSGAQYVGSGINRDVRRVFRDRCLRYQMDGSCAGDSFFTQDGPAVAEACGACVVGTEPQCAGCLDLYEQERPVNITLHLEIADSQLVTSIIESVKPGARKVVAFSDDTHTSQGWRSSIMKWFAELGNSTPTPNISLDFDRDWHIEHTKDDFIAKVMEYQSKPEYVVWIPSALAFLPKDCRGREAAWQEFLEKNKLGEVLLPGVSEGALLSAFGHPDSMGRVCAQYTSMIVRGVAKASMLPILTTPLSKVEVNVGRAMQLEDHGIVPIPKHVLLMASQIFTLCPPGQHLKEGRCAPCPEKTFKSGHGDSPLLCLPCQTAEADMTGLTACPSNEPKGEIRAWLLGVAIVGSLAMAYGSFSLWRLRRKSDSLCIIQEHELIYNHPVEILGRGTFGWVFKAEYRGTSVAVKRAIPRDRSSKLSWELCAAAVERSITARTTGTSSSTCSSDFVDVENGFADPSDGPRFRTVTWRERRRLREDFIAEMRVLSRMRHPCVTTIMGTVISPKNAEPMLVMELMERGSLYDILHNRTVVIENELALPVLCDVTQGLRFLHAATPAIVHGDLKAQNVLVDGKFRAKVADFGLSQKQKVGACGTLLWMAPELLRGGQTTAASDVYAFGILLNEVCTRQDPYVGEGATPAVLDAIKKENKRPEIPRSCCEHMAVLMRECWNAKPEMRPTAQELDRRFRSLSTLGCTSLVSAPTPSLQQACDEHVRRTDDLLYDVFPKHVADQLRAGKKVEPEAREIVTIFFSDIVGFTDISSSLEPRKISNMLDRLYTKFDALSREQSVFKVETIGDAYMAVSNLAEDQHADHAKRIAQFAVAAVAAANDTLIDEDNLHRGCINIRVGFHSGPVVATVVGTRNPRYCLFGDTVNTASRMESNSTANHIHCSARAASLLQEQAPEIHCFRRGLISIKGKGEMETYWVAQGPPAGALEHFCCLGGDNVAV